MNNDFKIKNGSGRICCKGCGRQDRQLNTYDWMADVPGNAEEQDMVEVQFKNTRKGYFKNSNKLKLEKGDVVAVESSPGHDIGVVTLTGRLVPLQMKKANLKPDVEIKRVYRKAKPVDLEKYEEAKAKEHATMIRSRQIALDLRLNMKIGDVEYQGDGNKAIFYYIADERVDFRQLIKVLAENFRVRIEMKQIGARQEAGRIGGIGPCGRELCCATWMTSFNSVSTSAARYQDISLNPQKLAGQCAKLKCCMNYEVDVYVEAQKRFPSKEVTLETQDGTYYFFKADILKGTILYSTDKHFMANVVTITTKRAFDIINMNKRGERPEALVEKGKQTEPQKPIDLVEQESLTRFDKAKSNNKKKKKRPFAPGEGNTSEREETRPPRERKEGERSPQEGRGERRQPRPPRAEGEQNNQPPRRKDEPRKGNNERPERTGEEQEKRGREQGERNRENRNRSNEPRGERPQRKEGGDERRKPRPDREGGRPPRKEGERNNPQRPNKVKLEGDAPTKKPKPNEPAQSE
ncbi:MAG: regulatory iron-sulfur-containing complex subunit RicT [Phocaeicola sp.]